MSNTGHTPLVRVKPLEWNVVSWEGGADTWTSDTVLGRYHFEDDGFSEPPFILTLHQLVVGRYGTPEAAKSAAQADYERRILSAIEPSPSLPILVEALEKCQRNLALMVNPETFPATSVQHAWAHAVEAETAARAALASIKGGDNV